MDPAGLRMTYRLTVYVNRMTYSGGGLLAIQLQLRNTLGLPPYLTSSTHVRQSPTRFPSFTSSD